MPLIEAGQAFPHLCCGLPGALNISLQLPVHPHIIFIFLYLLHHLHLHIPLLIWDISWTPHFVEYRSNTRAKMAESHTTKSKPWPQWGRYSHYKMGPRPCIWLLFLDPFGLNYCLENWNLDFFWIWIRFCHKKMGETKMLGVWFCSDLGVCW